VRASRIWVGLRRAATAPHLPSEACITGVLAQPERRAGRESDEGAPSTLGIGSWFESPPLCGDSDVNVASEDDLFAGELLVPLPYPAIAVLGGHLLIAPMGEGMSARGGGPEIPPSPEPRSLPAAGERVLVGRRPAFGTPASRSRSGTGRARASPPHRLRLERPGRHPTTRHGVPSVPVDDLILLLDPDCEVPVPGRHFKSPGVRLRRGPARPREDLVECIQCVVV
jgi:hypothetical protein